MTFYPYDLPSMEMAVGTFKVKLFSEFADLGTHLPVRQTIKVIGDTSETMDRDLGVSDLSTMQIELRDDRTYYAQGFWYKVLQGETRLRFYLSEGGTDKFYFFGTPQQDKINWSEWAIKDGVHIRTVELDLLSMARTMMDTPTATWMTGVLSHDQTTGKTNPTKIYAQISLKGLFAELLEASGLNPSYREADVSFVYDQQDFKFKIGSTVYTLDDLSIATMYDNTGTPHATAYFDNGAGGSFSEAFVLSGELLSSLLFNFGLLLHMDYDTATERHNMKLIQRGRAYADAASLVFDNREKVSGIKKATTLYGDAVKIDYYATVGYVWRSKKGSDVFTDYPTAPPNYVSFDIEKTILFETDNNPDMGSSYALYAYTGLIGGYVVVDNVEYWNYQDQEYDAPSSVVDFAEAICGYYFFRFTTKFSQVTRRYATMTADDGGGESFTNLNIGRRTVMDLDGEGDVTYYANRVIKKPMTAECEVEWVKE